MNIFFLTFCIDLAFGSGLILGLILPKIHL